MGFALFSLFLFGVGDVHVVAAIVRNAITIDGAINLLIFRAM